MCMCVYVCVKVNLIFEIKLHTYSTFKISYQVSKMHSVYKCRENHFERQT